MPTTEELIRVKEAELEGLREQAAHDGAAHDEVDTSQMPGGTDSAPVSEPDSPGWIPTTSQPAEAAAAAPGKLDVILDEGINILHELKAGASISEVADKLLDQNGIKSIVKAIGDLAGKVGL